MATHKSAEKRARQALKKNASNRMTMSVLRTFEKKLRTAITAKDLKTAEALLVAFSSKIDRAAKKGVVHTKNASRRIGRLSAHVSALK